MPYALGLLEGFQARRDSEFQRNYEADNRQRQQEGQLYQYLLQSTDPEIRSLALHGLFTSAQPGKRQGGFKGYMGEMQQSSTYPQIRALADTLVPDTAAGAPGSAAGAPPARPGSAALPDRSPVEARAQQPPFPSPQVQPPQMTDPGQPFGAEAPPGKPPMLFDQGPLAAAPGGGMEMGPPPESPFKRRGTSVPTAEEIAEMQARVPLQARIGLARQNLPPEMLDRAVSGILGAPQSSRNLSAVAQWGVRSHPGGPVQPVLLDQQQGYTLPGGQPIPATAEMVRMNGSGASAKRNVVPDDSSPTGYMAVYTDPTDGTEVFRTPTEYNAAPTLQGTTTLNDLNSPTGRSVVGVSRNQKPGVPIGPAEPSSAPTNEQVSAEALLAEVDKAIAAAEAPAGPGRIRKPVLPAQRDDIAKQRAVAAGLPYQNYFEVQQAAKRRSTIPTPTTPGGPATPSVADQVRQRALQNRKAQAPPPEPPRGRVPAPMR